MCLRKAEDGRRILRELMNDNGKVIQFRTKLRIVTCKHETRYLLLYLYRAIFLIIRGCKVMLLSYLTLPEFLFYIRKIV